MSDYFGFIFAIYSLSLPLLFYSGLEELMSADPIRQVLESAPRVRLRDSTEIDTNAEPPLMVRRLQDSGPKVDRSLHLHSESLNPLTGKPYSSLYDKLLEARQRLPVFQWKDRIVETVRANPVTILVGETGSGKTTQVPQFLAALQDTFSGRIACTQPRRIAAMSVASRVAQEMDVKLGVEVGYHVRFQPLFHPTKTKVLYMTDGLILRECMTDPQLRSMSIVLVDEVHERTKSTDVALGLLKRIVESRPEDFRVVVMSATLDIDKISSFFPSAQLLKVPGRLFPVDVLYLSEPIPNYTDTAVECVMQLHQTEPRGDILCFLTSEMEIRQAVQATKVKLQASGYELGDGDVLHRSSGTDPTTGIFACCVLPLYGALTLSEQERVFQSLPSGIRKVVFCTNIAETSVTVDGVVFVVDCCYQKQTLYNAGARVEYLLPAVISKASADQRKGRAGRTRPGKCFRLVTRMDYAKFPDQTYPEMLRSSIMNIVLLLLEVGVENPCQFQFLDPPSEKSLHEAFFQLLLLGTVDENLQLTDLGRQVAALPVEAPSARMLLKAAEYGCAADVAAIVAMSEGGAGLRGAANATSPFAHPDGDHITHLFLFHEVLRNNKSEAFCVAHKIRSMHAVYNIYGQLRQQMERLRIPFTSTFSAEERSVNSVALRKALLQGLFLQVAFLISPAAQLYRTVNDSVETRVHRDSILLKRAGGLPRWVMYERLEVQGEDGVFMRRVTEVQVEWLLDVSDYFRVGEDIADRDIAFALEQARQAHSRTPAF